MEFEGFRSNCRSNRLFSLLVVEEASGSDFGAILDPPAPPKTFKWRLKNKTKKLQKDAPREAKMSPRSGPGPKTTPRAARSAPRGAQEQPGASQEGTKRVPRAPKVSRSPSGGPRVPFWPHFWGPEASFSSILGVLFEARARSARQSKTLFEIIGQKVLCRFGRGLPQRWKP